MSNYLVCVDILKKEDGKKPADETLLAYDNCPVLAIVCTAEGHQWRCPRERLYVSNYCRHGMFTLGGVWVIPCKS